eukprot:s8089_g3.t1
MSALGEKHLRLSVFGVRVELFATLNFESPLEGVVEIADQAIQFSSLQHRCHSNSVFVYITRQLCVQVFGLLADWQTKMQQEPAITTFFCEFVEKMFCATACQPVTENYYVRLEVTSFRLLLLLKLSGELIHSLLRPFAKRQPTQNINWTGGPPTAQPVVALDIANVTEINHCKQRK